MIAVMGCRNQAPTETPETASAKETLPQEFQFVAEQVADLQILRYQVPGFDELEPKQKEMLYYLYEAARYGRDLIWAQNYKHNLLVRHTLENIHTHYKGERNTANFKEFTVYLKRVWFSNGIHHHYSNDKMFPEFDQAYFAELVNNSPDAAWSLKEGQTLEQFIAELDVIIFDPTVASKMVSLDSSSDLLTSSATNNYDGVTQVEAEAFYQKLMDKNDPEPVSYGLNSQLAKVDGKIVERVIKVGGLYTEAIEKIVYWLEKASGVAENDKQKAALDFLIDYYKTGDLKTFDKYNIAWVADVDSRIDVVNGFIETYDDPLGYRGAFESVVSIRDMEATKRITAISEQAQWFEDNSPLMDNHKKAEVKGISAKVITVVTEGGDATPSTPIGINLPNSNWIRTNHGSKSVNLGNIVRAYNEAKSGGGVLEEFAYSEEEIKRSKEYGSLSDDLETDMHEVIGHASGQLEEGVGTTKETLKNYSATLEEARADLVALYFLMNPKLIEIGVMSSLECGKAQYDSYIRNGLMLQLRRLKLGDHLEEAHMRNRQLVASWAFEKGVEDNVIEKKTRDGKTFFVINDYEKLQTIFGQLLREIQRIKSQGDYEAGKALVEDYGVKVDRAIHEEVLQRTEKLNIPAFSGFINPILEPVSENGVIVDVKINQPKDFTAQMLDYSKLYSVLNPRL